MQSLGLIDCVLQSVDSVALHTFPYVSHQTNALVSSFPDVPIALRSVRFDNLIQRDTERSLRQGVKVGALANEVQGLLNMGQ